MEILIVDSDVSSATSLSKQLALRGCEVHLAKDAPEALPLIERFPIDAALLSLAMLKESAIGLIRHIKVLRSQSIILVLAEQGQLTLSIRCMHAGATDDMIVPVDVERLVLKLNQLQRKIRKT